VWTQRCRRTINKSVQSRKQQAEQKVREQQKKVAYLLSFPCISTPYSSVLLFLAGESADPAPRKRREDDLHTLKEGRQLIRIEFFKVVLLIFILIMLVVAVVVTS
jgi:hypothetical protein